MRPDGSSSLTPRNAPGQWWQLESDDVVSLLASSDSGLDDGEAEARLNRYGRNELPEQAGVGILRVLVRQFASPLIYILLLAAVVTLVLREYIDGVIILAILVINAVIGTAQEYRAERSMEALRRVATTHARVVRGGHEREIDARDLVPGDIVIVEAGAKVPADCRLLFAAGLEVDESLITGESTTVTKGPAAIEGDVPLGDRTNMLTMGSIVTRGRARCVVVATGRETELGQIARSVQTTTALEAPILERMDRFGRLIGTVILGAGALVFVLGLVLGHSVPDLFLTIVALMVAAIPEGLPVVMTITLAIGVNRMARRHVIIRRLPAVETLGSCTVIGSDKTGTLTQNRMTVQRIYAAGDLFEVSGTGYAANGALRRDSMPTMPAPGEPLHLILLAGVLNNEAAVGETEAEEFDVQGDPTEVALLVAGAKGGVWKEAAAEEFVRWAEVPFDPELRYSATFHRRAESEFTFVKGAPEDVLAMCASDASGRPLDRDAVLAAARGMAEDGLRVLGFAYREEPVRADLVDIPDHRNGLCFLGLQGMLDPPRDEVRNAVAACQSAGIRVVMITGDHATTALAIGRRLGIAGPRDRVLTGSDLDEMDDQVLAQELATAAVYARVSPQHKLRVVRALQDQSHVVAVTGDGVNDGPALKAANIGVAMGRSGTDVAKEAADMVVTDDNFVSIVAAVEEGRVVFDNVRKVTFFLIATGAAVILAVLASIGFGFPLPFLPAQLLWLNLVMNGVQDVFLAFEPGERDVLQRRPRDVAEGVISPLLWERTALAGVVMAAGTVGLFLHELDRGASLGQARTLALTTMVVFQMFHIGNARSEHHSAFSRSPFLNPLLFVGTAIALVVHLGSLYWGPTQFLLRFEPLPLDAWMRAIAVASTVIVTVEVHKLLRGPGGRLSARSDARRIT